MGEIDPKLIDLGVRIGKIFRKFETAIEESGITPEEIKQFEEYLQKADVSAFLWGIDACDTTRKADLGRDRCNILKIVIQNISDSKKILNFIESME